MTTPVSTSIGKLLKEKGFNLKPNRHLVRKTSKMVFGKEFIIDRYLDYDDLYLEYVEKNIPTISEVVMWFYEKHEIWIECNHCGTFNEFTFKVSKLNKRNIKKEPHYMNDFGKGFNSPTEAYEAAFKYCLTELI